MNTDSASAGQTAGQTATQYLSRPEGRIAYDIAGTGPLVILVPGMCDIRSTFRFIAPELVAAGYAVATTDLRGQGDSDTTFSSYGDSETADDVIALIESLGRPATIVGNSLGSAVAVLVSARRPELVSGIVLIGPFVRNPPTNVVLTALQKVLLVPLWIAPMWKSYLPKLYAGTKPADFEDYRASLAAAMRRPGYARTFSLTTQASHAESEQNLPRVSAPSLVIMGSLDPDFANPTVEANWIGTALKGSVVMIEDAGHYPHAQQPQLTASAIIDFLGRR